MKISVNIKRIGLTTLACLFTAMTPFCISTTNQDYTLIAPLLFSLVIPATNYDRIKTRKKYQAFILSVMLTTLLFFITVLFGVNLRTSFLGQHLTIFICVISGVLVLLINSIYLPISNLKFGLGVTSFLSLAIPSLAIFLKELNLLNMKSLEDPAPLFIVWQTVVGFAIAMSIWTTTTTTTTKVTP